MTCSMLWFGRNDVYRDTMYWVRTHYVPGESQPTLALGWSAPKMARFGREAEAVATLHYFLNLFRDTPPEGHHYARAAMRLLWPSAPAYLRRDVVRIACEEFERSQSLKNLVGTSLIFRLGFGNSPRAWETDPDWAIETGFDFVTLAERMDKPEDCITVLEEAAKFFEVTDRPDLVAKTMEWAQGVAAQNPEALHRLALGRGQTLTAQRRWDDVIAVLGSGFADQPPTTEFLEACLMTVQANLKLGNNANASRLFQKAFGLVGTVELSAGERANYYVSLSQMTGDAEWRMKLLEQARASLQGAGLDLIANSVDQEVAALALQTGDLPAAEEALIDVIDRAEQQRRQLAFDPLLRQRWFADNITPYRQLMRVAALLDDPELAIACGERMRGRTLIDQLAWKKVDMAVKLAPADRERLAQLRSMRNEAYTLLDRGMGGGAGASATRGMYMPIRGMYMPIRGALDSAEPATAEEMARLTELLEQLATEEAALESAIREQVPAYQKAASMSIPSGADLLAQVRRQPGLAILHYTFADEGLVVVGLSGGRAAKVALITDPDREALYEQIGHFREAIWKRSVDAIAQARELYSVLVAPVESALTGAKRVWIVADGAVQLVPFAALIDEHNQYLGARHAIAYAPSLTLALSSRGERAAPARSAVVLAAPDTGAPELAADADDDRGMYMPIRGMYMPVRGAYMPIRGEGVSSALTAMAAVPLPAALAEGEAIAAQYAGAQLLTGAEATKAALLEAGGDCGVLHIATHGYADPDVPEFSGLLLAGAGDAPFDVLTAMEVYTWPLKARLVTLSACQTALGRNVEGEGILGLSRAFIYAGAQDVVCSLWPVSDESTKTLMTAFYASLAGGASVEEALQRGQGALPQSGDKAHPFYWAGFIAVRGPE